jgi:hypothetical protein
VLGHVYSDEGVGVVEELLSLCGTDAIAATASSSSSVETLSQHQSSRGFRFSDAGRPQQ